MNSAEVKPPRLAIQGVLLCVLLNAAGQTILKDAVSAQPGGSLLGLLFNAEVWAGLALYALSSVSWLWVLSRSQLSLAYPLLALSFPIVVALSAVVFSEPISLVRWLGVATIVAGVSLLART